MAGDHHAGQPERIQCQQRIGRDRRAVVRPGRALAVTVSALVERDHGQPGEAWDDQIPEPARGREPMQEQDGWSGPRPAGRTQADIATGQVEVQPAGDRRVRQQRPHAHPATPALATEGRRADSPTQRGHRR